MMKMNLRNLLKTDSFNQFLKSIKVVSNGIKNLLTFSYIKIEKKSLIKKKL